MFRFYGEIKPKHERVFEKESCLGYVRVQDLNFIVNSLTASPNQYVSGQLFIRPTCVGIKGITGWYRELKVELSGDAEFFGVSYLIVLSTEY